jgi:hypothetical protein
MPMQEGADHVPSDSRDTTIPDPPCTDTPNTTLLDRTKANPAALDIIPRIVDASTFRLSTVL